MARQQYFTKGNVVQLFAENVDDYDVNDTDLFVSLEALTTNEDEGGYGLASATIEKWQSDESFTVINTLGRVVYFYKEQVTNRITNKVKTVEAEKTVLDISEMDDMDLIAYNDGQEILDLSRSGFDGKVKLLEEMLAEGKITADEWALPMVTVPLLNRKRGMEIFAWAVRYIEANLLSSTGGGRRSSNKVRCELSLTIEQIAQVKEMLAGMVDILTENVELSVKYVPVGLQDEAVEAGLIEAPKAPKVVEEEVDNLDEIMAELNG